MAKRYKENGKVINFYIVELTGKGKKNCHVYNDTEEAAKSLLNSSDKKYIKMFDNAINRLLKPDEWGLHMMLNVDYVLKNGERCKDRRLVMMILD